MKALGGRRLLEGATDFGMPPTPAAALFAQRLREDPILPACQASNADRGALFVPLLCCSVRTRRS
jgi:hypothetical protein